MFPLPPIPHNPQEGFLWGWVIFVPLLVFMIGTAYPTWRWTAHKELPLKVLVRSVYLTYFLSPSLVGAGGHVGGVLLPGPAFLMLTFSQWWLKLHFGAAPILLCWPLFALFYYLRETRQLKQPVASSMFRFRIPDVLWLTVVVALSACWFMEHFSRSLVTAELRAANKRYYDMIATDPVLNKSLPAAMKPSQKNTATLPPTLTQP
jgi:hypothetical protein